MSRRSKLRAAVACAALIALVPPAAAHASVEATGGDTNEAVAVNTEDGASIFRFAFSVRRVVDGVVDQENLAAAYASCTDCRTVALAFQVVLVVGGADVVTPTNQAVAYNDQCAECLTFASATQIVVGVDGPVRLTPEGIHQLNDLQQLLRELQKDIDSLSNADLVSAVSAIKTQLGAIFSTELVPVGPPPPPDEGATAAGSASVPPATDPTTAGTTPPSSTDGTVESDAPPTVAPTVTVATSTSSGTGATSTSAPSTSSSSSGDAEASASSAAATEVDATGVTGG